MALPLPACAGPILACPVRTYGSLETTATSVAAMHGLDEMMIIDIPIAIPLIAICLYGLTGVRGLWR
jgi:hypothetical protein